MEYAVISDPHACFNTLKKAVDQFDQVDEIWITGDLIDRGPYPAQTAQYVRDNDAINCILGNHEHMYMYRKESRQMKKIWLQNGGRVTKTILDEKTGSHEPLTRQCHDMPRFQQIECSGLSVLITHGGIGKQWYKQYKSVKKCFPDFAFDPTHPDFTIDTMTHSPIWNRDPLANITDTVQIIGHTPKSQAPYIQNNNVWLDVGCVFNDRMGQLGVARFNSNARTIDDIELFSIDRADAD